MRSRAPSPRVVSSGAALALVGLLFTPGCGGSSGGGSGFASTIAPTTSSALPTSTGPAQTAPGSTTAPSPPPGLAPPDVVPLVCIHGITGDPVDFGQFLALYQPGRVAVPALYADEADLLKPGDLPRAVVVSAGYYRESAISPLYDPTPSGRGQDSIGGCPTPRTDNYQAAYPISYVSRIERIVDGVRRATGSDRVDLALHSMGNLVGRAYTRWHSDGAAGGTSKVRRLYFIAGPQRGINAIEAFSFGWIRPNDQLFMRQGEIAEMCQEYPVWSGYSFIDLLNDGWDTFCANTDVAYGGLTATGAVGSQNDPRGSGSVWTATLAGILMTIQSIAGKSVGDLTPFWIIAKTNVIGESIYALGPNDGVVKVASSRLDQPPFGRTQFWAEFEGRHEGPFNYEQSVLGSTVTVECMRQFAEGTLATTATVSSAAIVLEDAPGHASWIAVETTVAGGDLWGAQLVEQDLDSSGNVTGYATGYGFPVHVGTQRAFVQVPAGGGSRRYHLVLYGPGGQVAKIDKDVALSNGTLDAPPETSFTSATSSASALGTTVHASFGSNAAANDPTLAYSFRFDAGAWSSYGSSASFDTPALAPGEHRLEARARHSSNGAQVLADDARGTAVGLFIDASGGLTVRK